MKSFLLHDGEDEDKTTELTELMASKGLDWEGDNSGLTVWHSVAVGDTMLFGDDGSFRVLPKNVQVTITKHSFRHVFEAMLAVEHDNGAHHANRIHPGMVNLNIFLMPYDYGIEKLLNADEALGWIKEHDVVEYEDLIIGEQGDQEAVVRKHRDEHPGIVSAHELINDWFNGWEKA